MLPFPCTNLRAPMALLALIVGLPAALTAQAAGPVHEGDRVRVRYELEHGTFHVLKVEAEGLVLQRPESSDTLHLPYERVRELAVDRGPRSRGQGANRGFLWGGLTGAVGGAILGFLSGDDECTGLCFFQLSAGEKAAFGAVAFGAFGGAGGALIGSLAPGRRWEPVEVPIEVGVGPSPGGGVLLGLRFRP